MKVAYRFIRHGLIATLDIKAIPAIVDLFRHGWMFTNSSDTPSNSLDVCRLEERKAIHASCVPAMGTYLTQKYELQFFFPAKKFSKPK
jgi:hypothetical protein